MFYRYSLLRSTFFFNGKVKEKNGENYRYLRKIYPKWQTVKFRRLVNLLIGERKTICAILLEKGVHDSIGVSISVL